MKLDEFVTQQLRSSPSVNLKIMVQRLFELTLEVLWKTVRVTGHEVLLL